GAVPARVHARGVVVELREVAEGHTLVGVRAVRHLLLGVRRRGLPQAPAPYSEEQVTKAAYANEGASLDDFPQLLDHLARVHPSRYGALTDGLKAVCLTDVRPVPDQSTALRLVVLADRLYDREVPVLASGLPFDQLFSEEMLNGGYRKKYFRAISRLTALARDAKGLVDPA
ncbi:AFG1/ZapE family ATPase, partial [Streptomyces graminilatus]|uniref:AFG1/ZapE family ATPase n=1 Tax=Streptomyces graminilatus TaxID=1464070 RepID=UPI000B28F7FE